MDALPHDADHSTHEAAPALVLTKDTLTDLDVGTRLDGGPKGGESIPEYFQRAAKALGQPLSIVIVAKYSTMAICY